MAGVTVSSLGYEKLGPGIHLRVPLQQRATLAFGHTAPDTELHLVVECLGGALGHDRTVPANCGRFSLRRSANEQSSGSVARHRALDTHAMRASAVDRFIEVFAVVIMGRPSASILCPPGSPQLA